MARFVGGSCFDHLRVDLHCACLVCPGRELQCLNFFSVMFSFANRVFWVFGFQTGDLLGFQELFFWEDLTP